MSCANEHATASTSSSSGPSDSTNPLARRLDRLRESLSAKGSGKMTIDVWCFDLSTSLPESMDKHGDGGFLGPALLQLQVIVTTTTSSRHHHVTHVTTIPSHHHHVTTTSSHQHHVIHVNNTSSHQHHVIVTTTSSRHQLRHRVTNHVILNNTSVSSPRHYRQ
jgi:hypothetical protein